MKEAAGQIGTDRKGEPVREEGWEGVLKEKDIWFGRKGWKGLLPKWQMVSLWEHTVNKTGWKSRWQKLGSLSEKADYGGEQIHDVQNIVSNFNLVWQKTYCHYKSNLKRMNWPNDAQVRGLLLLWSLFQRSWRETARVDFIWRFSCYLCVLSRAVNASKDRQC